MIKYLCFSFCLVHWAWYSASIHVSANGRISFFDYNWIFHYKYLQQLLYPFISVDGHLGFIMSWLIVNSAALNIRVYVSFWTSVIIVFPYVYSGVELLSHMVLYLVFWGICILFCLVAIPILIPTNSVQGFFFLHVIPNTCYL